MDEHQLTPSEPTPSEPSARRGKARERIQRRREAQLVDRTLPKPNWTWGVIAFTVVSVIMVMTWITISASQPMQPTATYAPTPSLASVAIATTIPTPDFDALNVAPWDGKGRVTILVMGLDKRPGESGSSFRTDSLILVSIDPATKSIGLLSIPRDLYVPIPGKPDLHPINTAYVIGELDRPGGGPPLTVQTVQYNLGIPIHHYAAVSFQTVIALVDAVGGVDINVTTPIDDPYYPSMDYGYDPLKIPAGLIHMNGDLALKYARTRHQTSDYDRTQRQQQVLVALRQKALKPDVLPGLVAKAPDLWNQLNKDVITDLSFDKIASLGWFAKDIPAENIHRGALIDQYLQAMQYQGITVVVPNRANLVSLMTQVFGADYGK